MVSNSLVCNQHSCDRVAQFKSFHKNLAIGSVGGIQLPQDLRFNRSQTVKAIDATVSNVFIKLSGSGAQH